MAIGKIDALFVVLGLFFGIFIFSEIYDWIKPLFFAGDMGDITLYEWLGVRPGVVALGVVIVALVAFILGEKAEKRFGPAREKAAE